MDAFERVADMLYTLLSIANPAIRAWELFVPFSMINSSAAKRERDPWESGKDNTPVVACSLNANQDDKRDFWVTAALAYVDASSLLGRAKICAKAAIKG